VTQPRRQEKTVKNRHIALIFGIILIFLNVVTTIDAINRQDWILAMLGYIITGFTVGSAVGHGLAELVVSRRHERGLTMRR
jgi:energy-converting hydrogenase Eha subunit G